MGDLVTYNAQDGVATITMDDGKVNALSPQMFAELNAAFDRAQKDQAVVVLTGRPGTFSAGFDLKVLTGGDPQAALALLRAGFELSARMLSFPTPVVVACSGHAIAMGMFLVLSGDYRVGAAGPYRITANEVAIGMTLPYVGIEVARQRLTPAAFNRAIILAEPFSPEDAVAAGFLDRTSAPEAVSETALAIAKGLAGLNMPAHAASKLKAREPSLAAIRAAMERDGLT